VTRWGCRRFRADLADLATGTPLADARALDAHLAGCEACRADLAGMRSLASELAAPSVPEPSEDFWRAQRHAIMRRVRTAPEPVARPWAAWRVAGAVATVLLAVLVVRPRFGTPPAPSAIERLDDDALQHLHDLLPAITPASAVEDADSDLLSIHDLGDDELDRLAELLGDAS
jgi:anti-sigma factor RsiW